MAPAIASTVVDRPAAEVFAYATDPTHFHEWQQGFIGKALAGARRRARHDDVLAMIAHPGPTGVRVIDDQHPAVYCLPGRRRIVLSTERCAASIAVIWRRSWLTSAPTCPDATISCRRSPAR